MQSRLTPKDSGISVGSAGPIAVSIGRMELHQYWGYEIFLQGRRWEVWAADGTLLGDGVGKLEDARAWIQQRLLRLACQLALERH